MKTEPHVSIDGVTADIDSIPDKSISYLIYQTVRANSPGFIALIPKMSDDCLKQAIEQTYLPNASYAPPGRAMTYNDVIIGCIVPELLKRLAVKED